MNMPNRRLKSSWHRPGAVLFPVIFCLAALAHAAAPAERSGKEVAESTCIACHGPGKDGAPRIGNSAEWASHAAQGLNALTRNAITGLRKMPAHGGQGSLTDLEMSRAISYMISGGAAVDPAKPYSSPSQISGEQLVKAHCQNCHADGKEGAPRLGNRADWLPRLKQGMEQLVQSSIRGHNAMPARSGINNLSDSDMKAAVEYMATLAGTNTQK